MRHKVWCLVLFVATCCGAPWFAGCSDTAGTPSLGTAGQGADTIGTTDTTAGDASDIAASAADTGSATLASCKGSALNEGFAAKDGDCKFLEKCPTLGQCYCGDKCPATKSPKCDPSLCTGNPAPKCSCGEACGADKKKCPAYICDPIDEKNCQELDDCVFVNTAPPAWCGCQKMPDHAPDCWCGAKNCTEPHPECAASKCAGKPGDKCIYVKGDSYSGCYCDTCGLFGDKAKCFFIICPL